MASVKKKGTSKKAVKSSKDGSKKAVKPSGKGYAIEQTANKSSTVLPKKKTSKKEREETKVFKIVSVKRKTR